MPTTRRMLAAAATAVLFVSGAVTQQPATKHLRTLLGKFVDADGEGVEGADVHIAFAPVGTAGNRARMHTVVKTDKRGRFRFKVTPCTRHLLWAIGPAGADGSRAVSAMQWATSGAPIELSASETHAICTLKLKGLEAWAALGPFRVAFAPGAIAIDGLAVDVSEDGTCTVPPLPAGRTSIDVLDKNGQLLTCITLSKFRKSTARTVPPMQSVPMIVVDANGKAIEGARIRQRLSAGQSSLAGYLPQPPGREVWRELGKTDATGKLTAKIANRKDPFETTSWQQLFFTASKEGHSTTHSGFRRHPYFDGQEVKNEGVSELKFTLQEGKTTVVRLMRDADNGLANQAVTVRRGIKIAQLDNSGWGVEGLIFHLTTDEQGRIKIPAVSNPIDKMQIIVAGDAVQNAFVPDKQRRMSPYRALTLHELRTKTGDEQQIDLSSFAKVQLRLLDESGNPAPDAQVMLISRAKKGDYDCGSWNTIATPDSAGRLALQLQPGRWAAFIRNKTSMAHINLKLEGSEAKPIEVRMKPMPTMLGRAVDGDGKPVANANLYCHSSTWRGNNRDETLEEIARSLNWAWISDTTTDKDGNFACRFLDLPGMTYEARLRAGKKQSRDFAVIAGEDRVTFTIK